MFNPQLYLLAYGRIYANKGAMTRGVSPETVDGMSLGKIGRVIEAMRFERYLVFTTNLQPRWERHSQVTRASAQLNPEGAAIEPCRFVSSLGHVTELQSAM